MKKVIFALALMSVTLLACTTEPVNMNEDQTEQFQMKSEELPPVGSPVLIEAQDNYDRPLGEITVKILCRNGCYKPGCGWDGYGVDANGQIWKLTARFIYNSSDGGLKDKLKITGKKWTGSGNPC